MYGRVALSRARCLWWGPIAPTGGSCECSDRITVKQINNQGAILEQAATLPKKGQVLRRHGSQLV